MGAGALFPDYIRLAEAASRTDLAGSGPVFIAGIFIICSEYKSGILHFANQKYVFQRIDDCVSLFFATGRRKDIHVFKIPAIRGIVECLFII